MTLPRKSFAPKPRKPLAPIGKKRLAEFQAKGFMPRSTLDKPDAPKTAPKAKPYTDTGPDKDTVLAVCERDAWRCTCCGDPIHGRRGIEWSISHRKLKAQGVDNGMANLALVDGSGTTGCHGLIHANPERARQAGWMLRSTENPEEIPMEHAVHGTVLLDNEGGFAVIQAIIREEDDDYQHPF